MRAIEAIRRFFDRDHHLPFEPAGVGAVLVLLLSVLYLASREARPEDAAPPAPTPTPIVETEAGELRPIPAVPEDVLDDARTEITAFLTDLYERAFLPPLPPPSPSPGLEPSPEPTPIPRPEAGELFTAPARGAIDAASPAIMRPAQSEHIHEGIVSYGGIVSVQDGVGSEAWLDVTFTGEGRLVDRPELEVRMRQTGRLLLIRGPDGWRVAGFDLAHAVEREVPRSPRPDTEAVRAAWWPR